MTLFNLNPYQINDLGQLREWVVMLREMVFNLQKMDECGRNMNDLLCRVNNEQGELIEALKEKVDLLKQQIEQYESAFSVESFNHVRRLN